jgi:lysophospholipase L1-like esterase
MKKFLITICLVSAGFLIHAQTDSLVSSVAATYRAGLPHFFNKIKNGKTVKVAYLGGSITRADNGWRNQTFRWLQSQYLNAGFEQIMAAIGGTGSDFGAYRLQKHVLQYNPDLVFVEFAVNDNSKSLKEVKESMEGIVRQIWRHNRTTDICFVYTFSKPQLELYQRGIFPVSASATELIADYYQIPSISMAYPAVKLISDGKMILQGKANASATPIIFSEDGVHPFVETGHQLYAEAIKQHFQELRTVGKPEKHVLKKALMPHNLENATMFTPDKVEKSSGWHRVDSVVVGKPFFSLMSSVIASDDTSDFIKIYFTGTAFGVVDVIGPSSGQIKVSIDNDPPRYINRFDEYATYYRMNYTILSGLSPGKHVAIIKPSPHQLDKAAILQKRNNKISNPGLYGKHFFYLGAILVNE